MNKLPERQRLQLLAAVTKDAAERIVDIDPPIIPAYQRDAYGSPFENGAKPRLTCLEHRFRPFDVTAGQQGCFAQLNLMTDQGGQVVERLKLLCLQPARRCVHDTQCTERQSFDTRDGDPGIKANMLATLDEMMVFKPLIQRCVFDKDSLLRQYRMSAERGLPTGFHNIQANLGLEPLPLVIHQRDIGDGHTQCTYRQPGNPVEKRLGRRIHQLKRIQDAQAFGFVGRIGCWQHGNGQAKAGLFHSLTDKQPFLLMVSSGHSMSLIAF